MKKLNFKMIKFIGIVFSVTILCSCPDHFRKNQTANPRVNSAMDELTDGGTNLPDGRTMTRVFNDVNPHQPCTHTATATPAPVPEVRQSIAGPTIISKSEWGGTNFSPDSSFRCMDYNQLLAPEIGGATGEERLRRIYSGGRIVVHHSAGPTGGVSRVRSVQRDHTSTGFQDIKYHFVIDGDGKIYEGRPLEVLGAHAGALPRSLYRCEGGNKVQNVNDDFDFKAIGIVMLGNMEINPPSRAQYTALKALVESLMARFNIDTISPHQHTRHGGTDCPGAHVLRDFARETGLRFSSRPKGPKNDIVFRDVACSAPSMSCN